MSVLNRACRFALGLATLTLLPSAILTAQTAPALDPVAVRAALIPRVNDGTFRGIATAWREGDVIQTAAAGVVAERGAAVDLHTRFPLGEAGAVFTAALLANLVAQGELSLDDLAQRFLPPPIRLPTRRGRAITLGDLAFHRSGLADVKLGPGRTTVERLDRGVRRNPLRFDIGSRYAFSQLGIDLLGLALARHLRLPLATAVHARILGPLGISEVLLATTRPVAGRDAIGHAMNGRPAAGVERPDGLWYASIIDAARFAAAASDTLSGPLASTFALMMRTRSAGPDPSLPVALGWRLLPLDGRDIYWHDAQDASGFSVYLAMDPQRRRAVAVLSNTERAVDAVAGQLLLGRVPVIASSVTPADSARRSANTRNKRPDRRK